MFNEKDCWRTKGMFICNLIKGLLSNNFQIIKAVFWRIAFTIQNHIRFQLIFRLIIIIPLIPFWLFKSCFDNSAKGHTFLRDFLLRSSVDVVDIMN